MKGWFPFVLASALVTSTLVAATEIARAQKQWPLNTPKYYDALMLSQHSIALKQDSTDDYLIAMANASDVNILAAATRFPATVPPMQGEWQNNFSSASDGQWHIVLLSFFQELASERSLTWARDTDAQRTFLVWSEPSEPELASIGRELLALKPHRPTTRESVGQDGNALKEMDILLADFYKNEFKWDGVSEQVAPDLKLSQLPPDLRAKITSLVLNQIRYPTMADSGFWDNDAFWQHATLQIRKQFPADNFRYLFIGGIIDPNIPGSAMNYGGLQAIDDPRLGSTSDTAAKAHTNQTKPAARPEPVAPPEVAPALPGPKITLTLKQRPLSELLEAAQQQTGVALSAAPNAVDTAARVTLRVNKMPLSEFTQALSGLYGVHWKENAAGGLEMLPTLSPLDLKISQMGSLSMYRFWTDPPRRDSAPDNLQLPPLTNWFEEITETVDPNDLTGHAKDWAVEGVPVVDLPPELQARLRLHMQALVAVEEMRKYVQEQAKLQGFDESSVLHVSPIDKARTGSVIMTEVNGVPQRIQYAPPRTAQVLAPDGRLIAGIAFADPFLAHQRERQQKHDAFTTRMRELAANHQPGTPVGPPPPPGVLP